MPGDWDGDLFGHEPYGPVDRVRGRKSKLPMKGDAPSSPAPQAIPRADDALPLFSKTRQSERLHDASPMKEKINLFIDLFCARQDRLAEHYVSSKGVAGVTSACANKWKQHVCALKNGGNCASCSNHLPVPFDGSVAYKHLSDDPGTKAAISSFAIRPDGTCLFLCVKLKGDHAATAANAYRRQARLVGVQVAVCTAIVDGEYDAWTFFSAPTLAKVARNLGSLIVTRAIEEQPQIGFLHYNALLPDRDKPERGGDGGAAQLPLHGRSTPVGRTVFVDDDLQPYRDQWDHLSSVTRLAPAEAEAISSRGTVLGIQLPVPAPDEITVWRMETPGFVTNPNKLIGLPPSVRMDLSDRLYIERSKLPSAAAAQFARLATFQNTHFYDVQAWGRRFGHVDRVLSLAEVASDFIALPRGCLEEAFKLAAAYGIDVEFHDWRNHGTPLPEGVRFKGELRPRQAIAFNKLMEHETGILVANPAFGKTVVGIASIARRMRNCIVLTFSSKVFEQWFKKIHEFLDIDPRFVGGIGDGRSDLTGVVDVALIQNMTEGKAVADRIGSYGHVVVDEVHHLPAETFGPVVNKARAVYFLMMTATLKRPDGHHPSIPMLGGPVRDRVFPKEAVAASGIVHQYKARPTAFRFSPELSARVEAGTAHEQDILLAMEQDEERNMLIYRDVRAALDRGRSPIVLTKRRDHLDILERLFRGNVAHLAVCKGQMSKKERTEADLEIGVPDDEERLILAISQFLGEGFDDSRVDSMHIAMPATSDGTLEQYAGRLQRLHAGKRVIDLIDYVDLLEPKLMDKAKARRKVFQNIGFVAKDDYGDTPRQADLFEIPGGGD